MTRRRASNGPQGQDSRPERNPGAMIRATGEGSAELVQVRRDLSVSLPLLRERVQELDRDVEETRTALSEERDKLRLLKNMKDIEARLAKLETQRATIEEEMVGIEEREDAILNPRKHPYDNLDVKDLLIKNKLDEIVGTQDPLIIKKALAQAKTMRSEIFSDSRLFQTSNGFQQNVFSKTLDECTQILREEYENLVGTSPDQTKQTLAQRLDQNEVYQRLKAKRDSLLEEITEVKSDLASLNVHMGEWRILIEIDRAEENKMHNKEKRKENAKAAGLIGLAGSAAGVTVMVAVDIAVGGALTAASIVAAALFPTLKNKLGRKKLSQEELESCARVLCESKISRLEENLLELGEQKNEALQHLQQEEQEIRNGDDG